MITKIQGEAPFQVLTNNFSISPSQEGYTLQISADGINYSNLFSVGANVTRLVTGVAANSYYRLLGNASEVSINWMKTCVTEGGGGGDMSNYYTKDETNAEISAATSPIQEQLDDMERVTASALTELHNDVLEISGATPDLSAYWTSAQTQDAIDEVAADVNEAFSAITETQQVASTGLNSLDDKISILSGNTYTKAEVDAEITSAKTYVDNRIDGYTTASTITITSTPMTEGYWLDFSEDTMTQNGPEFQMFKTSKSNIVVADTSNLNSGAYGYNQPGFGVYLMGFDSANDAYDIQMIVDLPSSVSLTPQNYNMDIPFIVGTSPVNRVALEWDNLSTSGYPNYFIYNTDTKIGHFAYDLNINEFVPGVVKSDGVITKVQKLTQAEYDAITTPDASILYIIINN